MDGHDVYMSSRCMRKHARLDAQRERESYKYKQWKKEAPPLCGFAVMTQPRAVSMRYEEAFFDLNPMIGRANALVVA